MKVYFTTSNYGEECLQKCKHLKGVSVGSVYCTEKCKHCYGAGLSASSKIIAIPDGFGGYDLIGEKDYVKCSMFYNEETRSGKLMRFKIWWWHHIGVKLNNLISKFK